LLGICYNYFGASEATIFSKRGSPRSGIADEALGENQLNLITGFVSLRSKVGLSLPGLQQAKGLTEIPFKSQLSDLGRQGSRRWSLRVYF
jgi:hypothetical protein